MNTAVEILDSAPLPVGFPHWTLSGLNVTNGRDPLALETITANQIMPILLPGVVVLSRRARYLSFDLFLVDEFRRRGGSTQADLGRFVRRGEFDLLLAVRHCPRPRCGPNAPATIGYFAANAAIGKSDGKLYERGESIEGDLGGYGQQYRSLLISLNFVAERGLEYGGEPLKIDRITNTARPVVDALRAAVESTKWYQSYLGNDEPIPREVLIELNEAACLCRLRDAEPERTLLHQALFGTSGDQTIEQLMRLRGFALTLEALEADSRVESSDAAWRRYLGQGGEGD